MFVKLFGITFQAALPRGIAHSVAGLLDWERKFWLTMCKEVDPSIFLGINYYCGVVHGAGKCLDYSYFYEEMFIQGV